VHKEGDTVCKKPLQQTTRHI